MSPARQPKPHAIVMIGTAGSGKTTFATQFARTFDAPLVDIEAIASRIDGDLDRASAIGRDMLEHFFRTKQLVVIDGLGATAAERTQLYAMMKKSGYQPFVIWVQTDLLAVKARLMKKYLRIHPRHEADALCDQLITRFRAPRKTEVTAVISGRHTYKSQAHMILRRLSDQLQPEQPATFRRPSPPTLHDVTARHATIKRRGTTTSTAKHRRVS